MFRIILSALLLFTVFATSPYAEFTVAKLFQLNQKINPLVQPYDKKVGLCFIDLETDRELQVNGGRKYPAASVAKMPIMAAAYHLAESGKLNLDQTLLFKEKDKLEGSGVLRWMKAGKKYSIRNLIRMMISLSDNTATKMVIDRIGIENINNYIKDLGLNNTQIVDRTMLNEPSSEKINQTSPQDMAYLCRMIQKATHFSPKSSEQMLAYMKNQRYRWGICKGVPPGTEVANKTGNLDEVLNDVGIIYSPAGNYILSIFTYGFEKKNARELINKISATAYQTYTAGLKTGSENQ
ncbi:MAG: serine hydrolase [Candidatus Margulisiibacteriota bacterium]